MSKPPHLANAPLRMKRQAPLAKSFEPRSFEDELYQFWEESGCFRAEDQLLPGEKPFCIMIPPPNVTGVLHMGHAVFATIQDIFIRWRRMQGYNTLWQPGTDHAGIATQTQVEKQIAKEGKGPGGKPLTRTDLGREKFLQRTWKWKADHENVIRSQLKRMGSSFDWPRERFTMDEGLSRAVRRAFVQLYSEGLIYRGERIINWCTRSQTALSDLEVIPTERKGKLWHIAYAVVDAQGRAIQDSNGHQRILTIATTRPETLLGDTAVAVHPEDERYRDLQGKFVLLPLMKRKIPIIADSYVEKDFGSGALKVTPAHDFNDYDLGQRHQLPFLSVIGKDGRITAEGGVYAGLQVAEAREKVLADLRQQGLLLKEEDHVHKVGLSERSGIPAEPVVSKQWFVKIKPLAEPAIVAVKEGQIRFHPPSWEKTYFEWMYNIRDWCISRQLWWGHRIPAWHCQDCEAITVSEKDVLQCQSCSSKNIQQDDDVLDTWFSSGLWPFSTLGWPDQTAALKTFYPGAVMETGFDIIFFWVARMIMMGMHFMKDVPFRDVYLHAMVRDEKGEKMSKTKNNVIDPLVVIDKQGADSLRFTFAVMAGQGRDIKLSVDRVEGYRAFCNKLWNAVKYFHFQLQHADHGGDPFAGKLIQPQQWLAKHHQELSVLNRWILTLTSELSLKVNQALESFDLNIASQALYDFTWGELCDWYIELSKLDMAAGGKAREQTLVTLHQVLDQILKLLHPFIPFVTEELWQSLPWRDQNFNHRFRQARALPPIDSVMMQFYPGTDDAECKRWIFPDVVAEMRPLKSMIEALRGFRGENSIARSVKIPVRAVGASEAESKLIQTYQSAISSMAGLQSLDFENASQPAQSNDALVTLESSSLVFRIDRSGLVDLDEERKRLEKEISKLDKDILHISQKLQNPAFTSKAPAALVDKEKSRVDELQSQRQILASSLQRLTQSAGRST